MRYTGAGSGAAFATVRTEALCILAAQSVVQLASGAPKHVKDISELLSAKLAPRRLGGSLSAAARVAAALCVTELVGMEAYLGQTVPITRDPFQLFVLLNEGTSDEAAALTRLVLALVRRRGLAQLPMWLQTFKEVILALPKGSGPVHTKEEAAAAQDRAAEEHDAHDDGAAIAGASTNPSAGADENSRPPSGATKAFAVSCLQTLLEQADPADASHFQCELSPGTPSSKAAAGERDCRLVNYLEIMVSLAAHACGSDEPSLAAAGLRLALLIVSRFRLTRDVQGQTATEDCPLLLVQFEAQMTTCIRHNMSPGSNPRVQALALELLRDMIATRACNSVQPLTMKLMQPFGSAAFEPDEKYCECASTKTFLFRLRSACEVLDSSFEEPTIGGHVKDLARWMESALRDSAVLLAGLPLPSIKTYQPACFCLADYKAVQPFFQETLPPILRGVCVLCRDAKLQSVSSDFVALALGIVVLLLGDASRERPEAELRVYVRLVKQAALHAAMLSHKDAGCAGPEAGPGSVVTTTYLLDMLQCLWQRLFRVPARCAALLPDLLEAPRRPASQGVTLACSAWRRR
ncbi:unnamed protein product [Prorocentrum cordatum]|uniref:Uncharacterized protein n=1 Tax=Prorocentrum cordatum TaxID=2364126 RepID=A0ABN9WXT2_9DINO|nr:unnamed protein product [Polarella glacialis]